MTHYWEGEPISSGDHSDFFVRNPVGVRKVAAYVPLTSLALHDAVDIDRLFAGPFEGVETVPDTYLARLIRRLRAAVQEARYRLGLALSILRHGEPDRDDW